MDRIAEAERRRLEAYREANERFPLPLSGAREVTPSIENMIAALHYRVHYHVDDGTPPELPLILELMLERLKALEAANGRSFPILRPEAPGDDSRETG